MSRFDEDTSMMRERRAATLIDLLKPELEPQTRARLKKEITTGLTERGKIRNPDQ